MIRSMTAFARSEMSAPWGTAAWEIRSVNNRFLDVFVRVPDELKTLDPAVREKVRARLQRGKVDVSLRLGLEAANGSGINMNAEAARRLVEAADEIRKMTADAAPVNPLEVLRWPGVIRGPEMDMDSLSSEVMGLLDRALDELVATREREGEKISGMVCTRCDEIDRLVGDVRERLPEVMASARDRLVARVAELSVQLDEQRLEQEVALLAQKSDAAEELDRLEAHLQEVRRVVSGKKPAGRRLDFLMQELNREANTLGSKSADQQTTRASVDLKVAIEQIREQIQNVE